MRIFLCIALILPSQTFAFQSLSIAQKYLEDYAGPNTENTEEPLLKLLIEQEAAYKYFYEGPESDGKQEVNIRNWARDRAEDAEPFYPIIAELLERPPSEFNIFVLELLENFLNKPETRPAVREMLLAFQHAHFNKNIEKHLEQENHWVSKASKGFVIGMPVAFVFCVFKAQTCSELANRYVLLKKVRESLRMKNVKYKKSIKTPKHQQSLTEQMNAIAAKYGAQTSVPVDTIGGTLAKKSYFRQYFEMNIREQIKGLMAMTGIAAIGGGGYAGYSEWKKHKHDGKFEYEYLSPPELENKYFTALAILELTCRAKEVLLDDDISKETLRKFILDTNAEILLLGRMSGRKIIHDKIELEFVSRIENSDEIKIEIQLTDDYIYETTRNCPGISETTGPIQASYTELESLLMNQLLERFNTFDK